MTAEQNSRLSSLCVLSTVAVAATAGAHHADAAVIVTNVNQAVGFKSPPDTTFDIQTVGGGGHLGVFAQYPSSAAHALLALGSTAAKFRIKTEVIGGYRGYARPLGAGVKFSDAPTGNNSVGQIELATSNGRMFGAGAFSHQYYSFSFDNGGTTDYGWIQGSLTDTTFAGLTYTFERIAYDNTGAQLPTGSTGTPVPEPTSGGVILAGLLVTGATGVRRSKRTPRPATTVSAA